jgi:hypothetical protein
MDNHNIFPHFLGLLVLDFEFVIIIGLLLSFFKGLSNKIKSQ